jgi:RNA polymerase sigma-70 factor (ECF subfamily)
MTSRHDTTFAVLIGQHIDALYRAAFRLAGNRPDAEDLVQEVCLRAYTKVAELEGLDQPKGWLLKVQYRVFLDGARHRNRSPFRPMPEHSDATTLPSSDPGPEELVEGSLVEKRLHQAWRGLERQQRALLALHAEGYSLAEIQQITDLSTDVLKARLYRARVRLGKLLGIHARPRAARVGELT